MSHTACLTYLVKIMLMEKIEKKLHGDLMKVVSCMAHDVSAVYPHTSVLHAIVYHCHAIKKQHQT